MYYETVFIVNPDVSQENTQTLTDALVKRVEKAAGRIVKREYWGSRPLAYQIAKRKRGHYVLLVTDGEPAAVEALEQGLRLEERVMRFLTTRLTELSETPSPLMRRRAEPAREEAESAGEAAARPEPAEKVEEKATAAEEPTATTDNAAEAAEEEARAEETVTVKAGDEAAS